MIRSHADVVGSLLRPAELLAAEKKLAAGELQAADFKKIEDRAVDQAVALQEEAGLQILTDGEMRRQSFQSQMTAAVDGFGEHTLDAFLWGQWHGDQVTGELSLTRPLGVGVVSKLRRRRHLCAEEFTYLRARTRYIAKVTLPSSESVGEFLVAPTLDSGLPHSRIIPHRRD
jgi:5-methyltetrahydropteroyltriglutamate--homocysteine methyltransferase